jgi:hypothetical protein
MSTPRKEHWTIVKRVFKYFCGTIEYVIFYQWKHEIGREMNLDVFVSID